MTFLATSFLWLLLGIPIVIALHFVRSSRQKKQVSAIFLWRRAKSLANKRKHFANTWLLLLQILFIALIALALAQPRLTIEALDRVIIIDTSASMAARDSEGQRLARAIVQAEDLFKGAGQIALIRAGLDSTVVQELTDNRSDLRDALQALKPADVHADISRSINLAKSIAPKAEIHLFSDSLPPENLKVNFHPITGDAQNIGITNFKLEGNQALISVLNTSLRPHELALRIQHKNKIIAQSTILVPSQDQIHIFLPVGGEEGTYRAYIEAPNWDGLDLDDEVFLEHKQLRVLISPPENLIEKAITAIPNLKVRSSRRISGVYDVLVTSSDSLDSSSLEKGNYFLYTKQSLQPTQKIVDWDRIHPLLRFVDLTNITVSLANLTPESNWQVLARTEDLSPAIFYASTPKATIVALNFHPSQSSLRYRHAFPILITNIMRQFEQDGHLLLGEALSAKAALFNNQVIEDDRVYNIGIYNLDGVNHSTSLLSVSESRLVPMDLSLVRNEASQEVVLTESEIALEFWLLAGALGFLVLEWFLRSRKRK